MFTFLAFGTLWFWLFIGAFIVFEIILADTERYQAATFIFVLFSFFVFAGNFGAFQFLIANPIMLLLCILGYFGLGVIWSLYKWREFAKECLIDSKTIRMEFLRKNGIANVTLETPITEELRPKWSGTRDNFYDYRKSCEMPKASRYKNMIIGWMSYWPFQIVASLIRDPFILIYKMLS